MSSGTPDGEEPRDDVKSPCIGLCMVDDTLGYCLGCGRTRREIGQWPVLDPDQKREVIRRAGERSGLTAVNADKASKA
jgi:predicted Fe-S protein YdhL (DUF1289 family)